MYKEPLTLDDPPYSITMYNDMVYKLFPDSPNVEAESLDAWVPVARPLSPNEKPDSRSTTAYRDLLGGIVEAFRC
jgi:hypothetical protein